MTRIRFRLAVLTLILTGMAATSAFAACPSLPDGPDSHNVDNGRARALCLQQELHDNTIARNTQVQIEVLQNSIQQLQIQRRFDTLPPVSPFQP